MFVQYLSIISIFNLVILAFYLFFKKTRYTERNKLLATIIFVIAYTQFVFLLFLTGEISNHNFFAYTDAIAISSVMPLFYVYLKHLLEARKIFIQRNLIHLLPVVPGFFYWICFLFLPPDIKQASIISKSCGSIPDSYLYIIGSITQIFYCIISLKKLNGFFFTYKARLSKNDIKEINWHFVLVYGFLILAAAFIALYLAIPDEQLIDAISTIILDLLFIFLLVFLLNRSSDYYFDIEKLEEQKNNSKPLNFNDKSLAEFIENEIKNRKLYLQNLNLSKISKQLSIPEYKISQAINKEYKMSVPDYINYFRVEMAKDILSRDKMIKMDFLAKECGFSTRTSFYNAFKKFTNSTPASYKDYIA